MNPENLQDELPEVIKLGPRIGKLVTHLSDGFTAPIEAIRRFKDGYEIITITDPVTGRGVADNPENFSIHF